DVRHCRAHPESAGDPAAALGISATAVSDRAATYPIRFGTIPRAKLTTGVPACAGGYAESYARSTRLLGRGWGTPSTRRPRRADVRVQRLGAGVRAAPAARAARAAGADSRRRPRADVG